MYFISQPLKYGMLHNTCQFCYKNFDGVWFLVVSSKFNMLNMFLRFVFGTRLFCINILEDVALWMSQRRLFYVMSVTMTYFCTLWMFQWRLFYVMSVKMTYFCTLWMFQWRLFYVMSVTMTYFCTLWMFQWRLFMLWVSQWRIFVRYECFNDVFFMLWVSQWRLFMLWVSQWRIFVRYECLKDIFCTLYECFESVSRLTHVYYKETLMLSRFTNFILHYENIKCFL